MKSSFTADKPSLLQSWSVLPQVVSAQNSRVYSLGVSGAGLVCLSQRSARGDSLIRSVSYLCNLTDKNDSGACICWPTSEETIARGINGRRTGETDSRYCRPHPLLEHIKSEYKHKSLSFALCRGALNGKIDESAREICEGDLRASESLVSWAEEPPLTRGRMPIC